MTPATRAALAAKAFAHTAAYDGAITRLPLGASTPTAARRAYPRYLTLPFETRLRAALRREPAPERAPSTSSATRRAGIARARRGARRGRQGAVASTTWSTSTPRSTRCASSRARRGRRQAHQPVRRRRRRRRSPRPTAPRARRTRVSAFGGIVALNRAVDDATAEGPRRDVPRVHRRARLRAGALERAARQEEPAPARDRRLARRRRTQRSTFKRVGGGLVVQDRDATRRGEVTQAARSSTQARADRRRARGARVRLARLQAREANAIVLAQGTASRSASAPARCRASISVQIAVREGGRRGARAACSPPTRSSRSPTASRPRRAAGVTAIAQPGGAMKDADVIAAADNARHRDGVHRRAALPALKRVSDAAVGDEVLIERAAG